MTDTNMRPPELWTRERPWNEILLTRLGAPVLLWGGIAIGASVANCVGCGASQEAATGASYAAIIEECDAREERIVAEAATREEAQEKLEIAMAYCDERRRLFRAEQLEAEGVE